MMVCKRRMIYFLESLRGLYAGYLMQNIDICKERLHGKGEGDP